MRSTTSTRHWARATHPELAIRLLKRGLPLDLDLEHQHYDEAATLLTIISKLDADTACEVAGANADAFAAGLAANHGQPFKSLTTWVKACDTTAPHLIDTVLTSLDEGVVLGWSNALRDSKSKRHIGPLVTRASRTGTVPAATEAAALIKRFPSLRKYSGQPATGDFP